MRQTAFISGKYKLLAKLLGLLLMGLGATLLIPLVFALFDGEQATSYYAYAFTGILSVVVGALLHLPNRREEAHPLAVRDGAILVVLSWASVILVSAIPFLFFGLTAIQALFESTSGWTTTGLSVVDVLVVPRSLLLWRSLMQFFGGAGLAIVMLTTLVGPYGAGFYTAEGRSDPLLPHIKKSVTLVFWLYVGYLVAGSLLYFVLGMSLFDAVNHAMAALSTGGFSTKPDSFASFNSVPIELATLVLMLLGSTNFAVSYQLVKGRFFSFLRNVEIKTVIVLLSVLVPLTTYFSFLPLYGNLGKALRVGVFELASALTTTGFSTVVYTNWPAFAVFVMICLMLIGGGINSTAGGLKQHRAYLLVKNIIWTISAGIRPRREVREHAIWRVDRKQFVTEGEISEISVFASLYFLTYALGVGALLMLGVGFKEALFEFASSLATVGLSIGVTGPSTPPGILIVETLGMFLGRLELIVIFVGLGKIAADIRLLIRRKRIPA